MTRHFLSIEDHSPADLRHILDLAADFKKNPVRPVLRDKVLGLIFSKSSTRTRVSFEVAMMHLGGHSIFLSSRDIQTGRGESFADTARVLSRYLDVIAMRTHDHQDLIEMATYSSVPVINGLSDLMHPCQVMADLLTIRERLGTLDGVTVAYVGDGSNNMAHSWIHAAEKFGFALRIATPAGYGPQIPVAPGSKNVLVTADPLQAARGADVLYTDVWVSMGQEEEKEKRLRDLDGYQINDRLLALASPRGLVMHCLPAHRGEEITASVIDGPRSVIFDQAENRLHINKALFVFLLEN